MRARSAASGSERTAQSADRRRTVDVGERLPGERDTKEHRAWWHMRSRCLNPKHTDFAYYAGRGITVCERWRNSYALFLADVGRAPSPKHSLDRIDNNGNYEPGNVRWATWSEQMRNRRPFPRHKVQS